MGLSCFLIAVGAFLLFILGIAAPVFALVTVGVVFGIPFAVQCLMGSRSLSLAFIPTTLSLLLMVAMYVYVNSEGLIKIGPSGPDDNPYAEVAYGFYPLIVAMASVRVLLFLGVVGKDVRPAPGESAG